MWSNEGNITGVTMVKNGAVYLREWVIFHLLMGLDKLVIYDDASTDNIVEVLKPFVDMGAVEYVRIPEDLASNRLAHERPYNIDNHIKACIRGEGRGGAHPQTNCQSTAFADCLARYKNKTEWFMVFDVDEYYFPSLTSGVSNFRDMYSFFAACGQIRIVMRTFGSNGFRTRPQASLVKVLFLENT
jgi:hypothetical protein